MLHPHFKGSLHTGRKVGYEGVKSQSARMWQQWVIAFLGLWIMAVPFIGITSAGTLTWTLAITGLLIAALSAWAAMMVSRSREYRERVT